MIVGADPSFTGFGLVAVPPTWDLDWRRVRAVSLGYGLPKGASARDWLRRTAALADDVCTFVDRVKAERVRIEQQLASGRAFNVPQLCELIGVVRDRLLQRCGIAAELVPQSKSRKLLLGWIPQANRKEHVIEALKAAGADFADPDQFEAFVQANWELHEIGAPCLTGLLGEKPKPAPKAKKTRAKKGQTAGYLDVIAGGAG